MQIKETIYLFLMVLDSQIKQLVLLKPNFSLSLAADF